MRSASDLRWASLVAVVGFLLLAPVRPARAAIVEAASCSAADLQAAIDAALASSDADDTVRVPACDVEWTLGDTIRMDTGPRKLRLIGTGQETTRIQHFAIEASPSYVMNLVEWANMTIYSDPTLPLHTIDVVSGPIRSSEPNQLLFWHDLTIAGYNTLYVLLLQGWKGLITRLTMIAVAQADGGQDPYGLNITGDGRYVSHRQDLGSGNALFIEDSTFENTSHTISLFCNAYVVFRHNVVNNQRGAIDIHGGSYQSCPPIYPGVEAPNDMSAGGGYEVYSNTFNNLLNSNGGAVSPRAGSAGIVTDNTIYPDPSNWRVFSFQPQIDSGACGQSVDCGTGEGQTCDRKYEVDGTPGCYQAIESWYIWGNTCVGDECAGEAADPAVAPGCLGCARLDVDYFLRAPDQTLDGFTWAPYTYPYPILEGCGDGTCDAGGGESCQTCSIDCVTPVGSVCCGGIVRTGSSCGGTPSDPDAGTVDPPDGSPTPPDGSDDGGCGCASGAPSGSAAALVGGLLVLALRLRRRRRGTEA